MHYTCTECNEISQQLPLLNQSSSESGEYRTEACKKVAEHAPGPEEKEVASSVRTVASHVIL